ncbi:hypothetical protein WH50_01465 [Pokkaliibacter plantistimulans]|uniref:Phenylacetic acid degradation protein PaaY n=2 Tax=Pseudomonadota TaxID=1224 RepID=A0ABX5M827_9GAMM|nr:MULTISPECIES: phenylacetic acid degradation protein PaaY [Pokkaliibacter]MDH2433926.1 phenylacetic acid degradation protein PaaY [Pokkaliibacter sp. MBI-7]PPC76841.1 phenylacetic acid degradation protein PaaY [Pokkaliibacter plantistimulans]PXF33045.1 hypothetical protein WH50_01465 [Pokkaliibacter plantistimulans]
MPVFAFDGLIPVVDPSAFIHPSAVLIGDVYIGGNCYIGPLTSLRGDLGTVEIRSGSHVQDNCVLHSTAGRRTLVEEDTHIAAGATLCNCQVGRRAFVGMGAVVLDGAVIAEQSMVSPGSVVEANFSGQPNQLLAGHPAIPCGRVSLATLELQQRADQDYRQLVQRARHTMQEVEPLPMATLRPVRVRNS